jgi:hypothetical protein
MIRCHGARSPLIEEIDACIIFVCEIQVWVVLLEVDWRLVAHGVDHLGICFSLYLYFYGADKAGLL